MVNILVLIYFGWHRRGHKMKINLKRFQTVNPEIRLILVIYERVWNQLLHQILRMLFQEKYFLRLYSIDQTVNLEIWANLIFNKNVLLHHILCINF